MSSAIDNLVQSSLESEDEDLRLEWIPCNEITNIEPTQIDNVHYAHRYSDKIMLLYALETAENVHKHLLVSLLEYTHFQHTSTGMIAGNIDDIPIGFTVATNS